jgi:hypothetical protein
MMTYLCGKGFFVFSFELKEDRDLIFQNESYFYESRGVYLNSCSLDFNLENNIPTIVSVWVFLPHLPINFWNEASLPTIRNTLKKFIDLAELKESLFSCAYICIEVDLEKGLLEDIQLTAGIWKYFQPVDYK